MKDFKIKVKDEKREFELEVGTVETKEEWDFLKSILSSVEIATMSPEPLSSMVDKQELTKENNLIELKNGYTALQTDIEGLHHAKSEFEKMEMIQNFPKSFSKSTYNEQIRQKHSTYKKSVDTTTTPEQRTQDSSSNLFNKRLIRGVYHYQTYYVCTKCKQKGKGYIKENDRHVQCYNCHQYMQIRSATDKGFPDADTFGNIFIAGEFVPVKTNV